MSLAFLFPGQGAQHPGMVAGLPDSPGIAATLREAEPTLRGLGLSAILDRTAQMQDTVDIQIGLLLVEVACARALCDDHALAPAFVAGHSVGAFAAAVTAGVLTLAEALTAVQLRGDLMQKACAGGDWGMAAVKGLPVRAAQRLVDDVDSTDEPLWVANINGATQTVVSGTAAALATTAQAARAAGARALRTARRAGGFPWTGAGRHRRRDDSTSVDRPPPRADGALYDEHRRPKRKQPRRDPRRPRPCRRPPREVV